MIRIFLTGSLLSLCFAVGLSHGESEIAATAQWQSPSTESLRQDVVAWSKRPEVEPDQASQLLDLWSTETTNGLSLRELLDQSLQITAPSVWKQLEQFIGSYQYQGPIDFEQQDPETWPPAFVIHHAKFVYGKHLAEQGLYDEALNELDEPLPSQVIDPAALLFFEAACQHYLLKKEECIATLKQLLARSEGLPVRYLSISQMMLKDIEPLEVDSLDEVARLMRDIERRLDLGRAGKKVRKTEDDVIAKLDKMIDQLEQQRKQQQQQSGNQSNPSNSKSNPSSPLEQQAPGDVKGPGEVDEKKIKDGGAWGNLPPKERQEALQQISNDYPAHYRRAIEEYFRKIAKDPTSN